MPDKNQEIYLVIIVGGVLALMLVGFIVTILFLYQRKQHRQEQELERIKDQYDQELLKSQLEIQEGTFKTIGQELHDNIGQVLSVVKLSLAILPIEKEHPAHEPILNTRQMLNKAIYDLADLTKSLHTDRIAQIGLVESIRFELDALKKAGLLEINFDIAGSEYQFDGQKGVFLFRIFQENINNILKHSKASRVNVFVDYSNEEYFTMELEDNGVGFDVEEKQKSSSSTSGVGLKSMYNRAKLMGGEISFQSSPGHGTTVTVTLPLPH
jgi:two-component system NarL family sensor kinase